jgi:hypothetical protein
MAPLCEAASGKAPLFSKVLFELTPNTDSESLGIEERPETLGGPKGPEHLRSVRGLSFSETRRVQSP